MKARWGLPAVFTLGLVLRCIGLQSRGIAYDDAFSILLAQQNLTNIIQGTAADTMPPLYYFLLHAWMRLGGQELFWLRILSVLLNLGAIYTLVQLVRILAGEAAALWAGLLASISPLQIYHAQDLRMYALLAFAQMLYLFCFARIFWRKDGRWAWLNWAGLVVAGTAAMYSHNLAIFVLVVPNVYLLLRRAWKRLAQLMAAQALIGLLALPWLAMLPAQIEKIQHAFWTPQPGLVEIIQSMMLQVTHLPLPGAWFSVGLAATLLGWIVLLWQLVHFWREKKLPGFLLLITVIPPALLWVVSYLMRPVFVTRGFLAAAMGFLALAGVVIAQRWPRPPAWMIMIAIMTGALVGLPFHYTLAEFPRSPFAAAMADLQSEVKQGDLVLHDNKLSFFPSHYYAPGLAQRFIADTRGGANDTLAPASQAAMGLYPDATVNEAVGQANQVYFVVFTAAVQEYQAGGNGEHPQLAWLMANFKKKDVRQYNDLLVCQFTR